MKNIFLLTFLLVQVFVYCQEGKLLKTRVEVNLAGVISNNLPIEMKLTATKSDGERRYANRKQMNTKFDVAGSYFYKENKVQEEIRVIGVIESIINDEGEKVNLILYELDSNYNKRAVFTGESNDTSSIKIVKGKWQRVSNKKEFPFSLKINVSDLCYNQQIVLNHTIWDLQSIFGNILLADELDVLEQQENKNSVAYLLYVTYYSNPYLQGECGSDPTDEKIAWIKFNRDDGNIEKKQVFDLTVCRGNITSNLEEKTKKNMFAKTWENISIDIIKNEFGSSNKEITNVSISRKGFWDGFKIAKKL